MAQRIHKQVAPLTTVEPKRHFVEIGGKMLRTHVMPSAHDAALEKREGGFDSIGVNRKSLG